MRVANFKNLRRFAKDLLGKEYSEESAAQLIAVCLGGFERQPGHISHSRRSHLEKINAALKSCGVEGMLLDEHGADVSGTCDASRIAHDVQYCNAGDTYALTVLYYNGRLMLGDWGSIVERLS